MDKQKKNFEFNPHEIEEQITDLSREQRKITPEVQLVHTLSEISAAEERIIQRTRTRLIKTLNTRPDLVERLNAHSADLSNEHDDRRRIAPVPFVQRKRENKMQRGFMVIAAVLVAALVVAGGFIGMKLLQPQISAPPIHPDKTPVATPTVQPDTTPQSFLYIVKDDGVFKLNPGDNSEVWSYPIDRENWQLHKSHISQADKTIFLSLRNLKTEQSFTRALDMQSGKLRWEQEVLTDSMLVADGTLYISTYMPGTSGEVIDSVRALEAATGKEKWSLKEQGWMARSAQDGKLVLTRRFIGQPASLSVRDSTNGKEIWGNDFDPAENFTSTPLIVDDTLYITSCTAAAIAMPANSQCYQHVYQAEDGKEVWILPLPYKGVIITDEVIANGVIYFGVHTTNGSQLSALSTSKREVLWSTPLERQSVNITSMVVSDTVVYIGTVTE